MACESLTAYSPPSVRHALPALAETEYALTAQYWTRILHDLIYIWRYVSVGIHLSMGDFANYWQAFVPHPLWFGYHFMSVYYHLKEHYVNFFKFFEGFLNYFIHPSNYWVYKNAYFQSFFLRIMDLEKKVKTYLYVKKSQLFEKILFFRSQFKKVLKIENWL